MIEFIRYLKGYVLIKVWGFAPERFFNLRREKHIALEHPERSGCLLHVHQLKRF